MLEERNIRRDLFAVGLLAIVVFLGVALATYDPADPPSSLVWPTRTVVANSCGRSGALVASLLFQAIGVGAYYLVLSLAVLDAILLARRPVTEPVLRAVGWLISLAGFTTMAAMALPYASPGPVIGSGGYMGAAGRGVLEMNFAAAGSYIVTLSLIAGGLLLCTDYVLIHLTAWLVGAPMKKVRNHLSRVDKPDSGRQTVKLRMRRTDVDNWEAPADDEAQVEGPVSIRISGKPSDDESADGADASPDKNGQAAGDAKPAAGKGAAPSALKVRNRKVVTERQTVMEELDAASRTEDTVEYELPPLDLLLESEPFHFEEQEKEVRRKAKILEKTFADFGFHVKVVEIETGPVIAQFEVELEAGLRLSKITSLADDLAIGLRVPSVRIVAPIPGKNTVGIEVPNAERQLVRLREVIEETNGKAQKMQIPIYLGKNVSGEPMVVDLTTLPHLLIAGRTGTGKSVCLNTIIVSMLMTRRPDEVRMLLIDPKMVELSPYKRLPHLMHPVVTDMQKAEAMLAWAVEKMEERYALLARAGVRHISVYNQLGEEELMDRLKPENDEERKQIPVHLPYVIIVADEMADLMMTAAKEVEAHIIRLAQKSRAVGIHLVLATQKPTVDVITGLIKSNLPARISFQVASRTDSRVVLDEMGADKLLGNGDMLFLWPGTSMLLRGQGTYLSDDEITRVVDFVSTSEPQFVKELVQLKPKATEADVNKLRSRDDLYEAAVDLVVREGRGSVSLLQRGLGIGYGRAARLVDFMAEDGIVGEYNGSQAREILITLQQWEEMSGQQASSAPAPAPAAPKRNRIVPSPRDAEDYGPRPVRKASLGAVRPEPEEVEDDDYDEEEEDDRDDDFQEEAEEEDYEEDADDDADEDEDEIDDEADEEEDDEESSGRFPPTRRKAESA
ncbi:MAG: DNA translocase FtsK [Pirellulales bacterium]